MSSPLLHRLHQLLSFLMLCLPLLSWPTKLTNRRKKTHKQNFSWPETCLWRGVSPPGGQCFSCPFPRSQGTHRPSHKYYAHFCFEKYFLAKAHKIVQNYSCIAHICYTDFCFVHNCVGQQNSRDISIIKLHTLGLHAWNVLGIGFGFYTIICWGI